VSSYFVFKEDYYELKRSYLMMYGKYLAFLVSTLVTGTSLLAEESKYTDFKEEISLEKKESPLFSEFTGEVLGERVRMRLQSNLEGEIVKELNQGSYVSVVGEKDEFYIVKPLPGMKAYVFRTYVLDDFIEGYRVNIRLNPDLESPVIAQLNTGDSAKGTISPLNNKWLQIDSPDSVKFYISKEYVKRAGGPELIVQFIDRQDQVKTLLNNAFLISQSELRKPFPEISMERVSDKFNDVIAKYQEFSDQVKQAEEGLEFAREAYLRKQISYLEEQNRTLSQQNEKNDVVEAVVLEQKKFSTKVEPLDEKSSLSLKEPLPREPMAKVETLLVQDRVEIWEPLEDMYYQEWERGNPNQSKEAFYSREKLDAFLLKGIVEPYMREIKNKPGDFILRDNSDIPLGYLYSTQVDLKAFEGKEVSVLVVSRPNNHFAFPAYYVINVE
jgi:hypothetical protein